MFTRIFLLFSALAMAAPIISAVPTFENGHMCNKGTIKCCQSIQKANSQQVQSLVGAALDGITGNVGIECTTIPIIGAGANSCTNQAACCNDKTIGLVSVECNPINL